MKTIYQCEKCGKEFGEWNQCYDHESAHIEPDTYRVTGVRYLPEDCECCDNDPRPYPLDIHVPMDDGSLIQYIFDRIINPAPAAAPIDEETTGAPTDNIENFLPEAVNE